jgi:hypothetical protein
MAFTYSLSTDIGKVRLLIPDRVSADAVFNDEEIETFLGVEGDNVKLAAALALETIAADEALVQKVQRTLTEETDGAKLAKALLDRASGLRNQSQQGVSASLMAGPGRRALTPITGYSYPTLNGYTHHGAVNREVIVEDCPDQ